MSIYVFVRKLCSLPKKILKIFSVCFGQSLWLPDATCIITYPMYNKYFSYRRKLRKKGFFKNTNNNVFTKKI